MITLTNALPAGHVLRSAQNEYRIERVLGAGGFGITYEATTTVKMGNFSFKAKVAIKEHFLSSACEREQDTSRVLFSNPVRAQVENSRKDFIAEAQRLYKVGVMHPNIVKVNEVFECNNTAYYVMEYLNGKSLRVYVKEHGVLPEEEMKRFMYPIIDAVKTLHEARMTHLDIKPDNIMLSQEEDGSLRPVLIDFGLSKHYDKDGHPTSTINTLGCSDGYAPIEQYAGITTFSPTADYYALGATMTFCLTGKDPQKSSEMLGENLADTLPAGVSSKTVSEIHGMTEGKARARVLPKVAAVGRRTDAPVVTPVADDEVHRSEPEKKKKEERKKVDNSTQVITGDTPKPNPSKKWMIIGAAGIAVVAFLCVFLFGGKKSDEELARERVLQEREANEQRYGEMMSQCEALTDAGDANNFSYLVSAKQLMDSLQDYQSKYNYISTNAAFSLNDLQPALQAKLNEAGSAWTRAAEGQLNVAEDVTMAIRYYQIAYQLTESTSVAQALNRIARNYSTPAANMVITDACINGDELLVNYIGVNSSTSKDVSMTMALDSIYGSGTEFTLDILPGKGQGFSLSLGQIFQAGQDYNLTLRSNRYYYDSQIQTL